MGGCWEGREVRCTCIHTNDYAHTHCEAHHWRGIKYTNGRFNIEENIPHGFQLAEGTVVTLIAHYTRMKVHINIPAYKRAILCISDCGALEELKETKKQTINKSKGEERKIQGKSKKETRKKSKRGNE